MQIIDCRYCQQRVGLGSEGICPSCLNPAMMPNPHNIAEYQLEQEQLQYRRVRMYLVDETIGSLIILGCGVVVLGITLGSFSSSLCMVGLIRLARNLLNWRVHLFP